MVHPMPRIVDKEADPVLTTRTIVPSAAGATNIGQREHNEDHVLLRPELGLFLLADGAGGHNAGNVASALATTTVANVFETTAKSLASRPEVDQFGLWTVARRLATAIHLANAEVVEVARKTAKYHGMGTTLVACVLAGGGHRARRPRGGQPRLSPARGGGRRGADGGPLAHQRRPRDASGRGRRAHREDAAARGHPRARHGGRRARSREDVPGRRGGPLRHVLDGVSDVLDDVAIEEVLAESRAPCRSTCVRSSMQPSPRGQTTTSPPWSWHAGRPRRRRGAGRPTGRPRRSRRPPIPVEAQRMGSAPEIIIVGVENHAVPMDSASASLMDALGRFARLRQPSLPEIAHPKATRCGDCGQPLESSATACPTCGTKVM